MNEHKRYENWLPLYAAGQLSEGERAELSQHLETCEACREELALWQAVGNGVTISSSEVRAPVGVAERALERVHAPSAFRRAIARTFSLLFSQAYLVRREMWPSAAILMFMGVAVTLLVQKVVVIRYLAPLIATASLAVIFGPDHDPACELTLATPTSSWKVLLARLALVHGYNLALTLVASLFLLLLIPSDMLWTFILGWLGPMTFLPALALLLSLWTGSGNSVAVAYGLWLLQFISPTWMPGYLSSLLAPVVEAYRQFWANPLVLVLAGLALLAVALWSSGRMGARLVRSPS